MRPSLVICCLLPTLIMAQGAGDLCTVSNDVGICESTDWCKENKGSSVAGYCPDAPSYVECCLAPLCNNGDGYCGIWGPGSCNGGGDGHLVSDECPGPSDYKCCAGPFQ